MSVAKEIMKSSLGGMSYQALRDLTPAAKLKSHLPHRARCRSRCSEASASQASRPALGTSHAGLAQVLLGGGLGGRPHSARPCRLCTRWLRAALGPCPPGWEDRLDLEPMGDIRSWDARSRDDHPSSALRCRFSFFILQQSGTVESYLSRWRPFLFTSMIISLPLV